MSWQVCRKFLAQLDLFVRYLGYSITCNICVTSVIKPSEGQTMARYTLDRSAIAAISRDPEILKRLELLGHEILDETYEHVPYDEKAKHLHLRDTGFSEIQGDYVRVGYTADYAKYVEYGFRTRLGTGKSTPKPPHIKERVEGRFFFSRHVYRDRGTIR